MTEMQDYSGDFKPDFQFSDLSKDALIKLLETYQRIFVGVCGLSSTVIGQEYGEKEALRLWPEIYDKLIAVFQVPLIREALNIKGTDVVDMLKYNQTCADGARKGMYVFDTEIKNRNHVVMTFKYCRSLLYYERHNDPAGIAKLCGPGGFEDRAFQSICRCFNPKIKPRALKLPPRKGPEDTCCIWEFKAEP